MLVFFLMALPVVACAIVIGLLWLPSRSTGWFVRADVGLAWFAALATLILVPTDVASALAREGPGHLAAWWKAAYWYGFLAQVLMVPLHMEFIQSGEFTIKARLAAAARRNLLYYALLASVGLTGLFLLLSTRRLHPSNILGFCIAFSNAYGLVAAIFLLGYGLVAVPRQLWKSADLAGEQRRLFHAAGMQAERTLAAHRQLSVAVLTARRSSLLFARHDPLRAFMDAVLQLANSVGPGFKLDAGCEARVPDESELDVFDRSDLADLRKQVKVALRDYEREQALYLEAVQQHLKLEAVAQLLGAGMPQHAPLPARLAWLWQCHLHFWAFRLLACLAAVCSLAIVVAEASIARALPNLSVISAALHATAGTPFLTEVVCFLFLAYPCACAYYSLYRLGRFAFYRMVPRHTDAYSLCYSALLMCRFAAPLAFNFMAALAMPEAETHSGPDVRDTVFYSEFGALMMRQPLIGWQFTTFAPILLVPYMLLLASGVLHRLMAHVSGGEELEFEDDWRNDSYAATGRRLLRLESENARNGLALGLTVEPTGPAGSGGGRSLGGGALAAGPADPSGAVGSSSDALLGTLRSAAAAAAAEEAAAAQGSWWRRLLPLGGGGSGGSGSGGLWSEEAGHASTEALAARGRLARLVARGPAAAGYSSLPSSAAAPSAQQGTGGGASRPMWAGPGPARPLQRVDSGRGGDSSAGSLGDHRLGSLGSLSPSNLAGGGMRALRAKYMAGVAAGGGGGGGSGSAAGTSSSQQQGQGSVRGSVGVEGTSVQGPKT